MNFPRRELMTAAVPDATSDTVVLLGEARARVEVPEPPHAFLVQPSFVLSGGRQIATDETIVAALRQALALSPIGVVQVTENDRRLAQTATLRQLCGTQCTPQQADSQLLEENARLLEENARLQEIASSARALIDRMDVVHLDPFYRRVWEVAQSLEGFYLGPKYQDQLQNLREGLEDDAPRTACSEQNSGRLIERLRTALSLNRPVPREAMIRQARDLMLEAGFPVDNDLRSSTFRVEGDPWGEVRRDVAKNAECRRAGDEEDS